ATAGLAGLTYALTLWSATRHFTSPALIALVTGVATIGGFLWVEYRRGSRAMMPLALFRGRCFSGLNLLTFLLYGAFGAAMLLIPYVLITSGGYSPVQAGLAMLPLPILMTAVAPTVGGVAARGGLIATALLGSVLASKGTALFAGFHVAMFVSAGVAAVSAVVALTMLGGVRMKKAA